MASVSIFALMKLYLICANDVTSNCLVCFLNNILPILQTNVSLTDCFLMCELSYLPQFPSSAVGFVRLSSYIRKKKGGPKSHVNHPPTKVFLCNQSFLCIWRITLRGLRFLILIPNFNILTLSFISKSEQTDSPSTQIGPRDGIANSWAMLGCL